MLRTTNCIPKGSWCSWCDQLKLAAWSRKARLQGPILPRLYSNHAAFFWYCIWKNGALTVLHSLSVKSAAQGQIVMILGQLLVLWQQSSHLTRQNTVCWLVKPTPKKKNRIGTFPVWKVIMHTPTFHKLCCILPILDSHHFMCHKYIC